MLEILDFIFLSFWRWLGFFLIIVGVGNLLVGLFRKQEVHNHYLYEKKEEKK